MNLSAAEHLKMHHHTEKKLSADKKEERLSSLRLKTEALHDKLAKLSRRHDRLLAQLSSEEERSEVLESARRQLEDEKKREEQWLVAWHSEPHRQEVRRYMETHFIGAHNESVMNPMAHREGDDDSVPYPVPNLSGPVRAEKKKIAVPRR